VTPRQWDGVPSFLANYRPMIVTDSRLILDRERYNSRDDYFFLSFLSALEEKGIMLVLRRVDRQQRQRYIEITTVPRKAHDSVSHPSRTYSTNHSLDIASLIPVSSIYHRPGQRKSNSKNTRVGLGTTALKIHSLIGVVTF
jgi:hypothetical protein